MEPGGIEPLRESLSGAAGTSRNEPGSAGFYVAYATPHPLIAPVLASSHLRFKAAPGGFCAGAITLDTQNKTTQDPGKCNLIFPIL